MGMQTNFNSGKFSRYCMADYDNINIIIIIIIIINFIRTDQYPRANKIMFYSSKSDSQINTHNKN